VNSKAGRISFTSSRGDVLLVLGCPEIKVGGTWHRINGVVMADGDQVLLPLEVLPWID
jgi:hypothetical protein